MTYVQNLNTLPGCIRVAVQPLPGHEVRDVSHIQNIALHTLTQEERCIRHLKEIKGAWLIQHPFAECVYPARPSPSCLGHTSAPHCHTLICLACVALLSCASRRNQADVGGELNYVELSLPPDNLPGGGYSDEDPCVYPSLGHRRSLCLNPPPPAPEDASDAAENIYATLGLRRGVGGGGGMRGMAGFTHHASNPNLYATLNYRRGVTTTTLNPSLYATLPHRRDVAGTAASSTSFASSISVNNINNTSPPGFRDLRRSFVGPLIRRPSESAV
ncbi:hypothetical protein E2C01_010752 [Portunus trituberculatus]|uniref:Uncharacterized protein n=1 Tax=Portunus trituberculatus TaxID=210409 RepID=A0A5B7D9L1_PORTR|nr:hypothetical protein [Portunus trituberculatus]